MRLDENLNRVVSLDKNVSPDGFHTQHIKLVALHTPNRTPDLLVMAKMPYDFIADEAAHPVVKMTSELLPVIKPGPKWTTQCHDSGSCRHGRIESAVDGMGNIKWKI